MVSTQWTRSISSCARSTGVEKSDPVKIWLASTGAKPMGHDDDDDDVIYDKRISEHGSVCSIKKIEKI